MPEGISNGIPDPHLRKQQLTWDEISSRAAKIISFIDLAGHERYLKTTLHGLTGSGLSLCLTASRSLTVSLTAPDYVMLVIGSNAGIIGMSKVCFIAAQLEQC